MTLTNPDYTPIGEQIAQQLFDIATKNLGATRICSELINLSNSINKSINATKEPSNYSYQLSTEITELAKSLNLKYAQEQLENYTTHLFQRISTPTSKDSLFTPYGTSCSNLDTSIANANPAVQKLLANRIHPDKAYTPIYNLYYDLLANDPTIIDKPSLLQKIKLPGRYDAVSATALKNVCSHFAIPLPVKIRDGAILGALKYTRDSKGSASLIHVLAKRPEFKAHFFNHNALAALWRSAQKYLSTGKDIMEVTQKSAPAFYHTLQNEYIDHRESAEVSTALKAMLTDEGTRFCLDAEPPGSARQSDDVQALNNSFSRELPSYEFSDLPSGSQPSAFRPNDAFAATKRRHESTEDANADHKRTKRNPHSKSGDSTGDMPRPWSTSEANASPTLATTRVNPPVNVGPFSGQTASKNEIPPLSDQFATSFPSFLGPPIADTYEKDRTTLNVGGAFLETQNAHHGDDVSWKHQSSQISLDTRRQSNSEITRFDAWSPTSARSISVPTEKQEPEQASNLTLPMDVPTSPTALLATTHSGYQMKDAAFAHEMQELQTSWAAQLLPQAAATHSSFMPLIAGGDSILPIFMSGASHHGLPQAEAADGATQTEREPL